MSGLIPMAQISDLMPYILPHVPAAPTIWAEFQTRLAVVEFCERTRCWRQIMVKNIPVSGRVMIAPHGATIHEFEEATLDGCDLTPSQFTATDPDEITGDETQGQAKYITQINPGEISVIPASSGKLRVSCFLKPRHGQAIGYDPENPLDDVNNVLPQFMVTQYAEALACGALYRIMATPKQDFTDLKMAGEHKANFEEACNRHFASNMRGQQRAPMRVKARWM